MNRWRIEKTIRFVKQSYNLEDIRVLTYRRLQNMMALVLAVTYFTMVYLGIKTKLKVLSRHVLKTARRLFGIPDFRFYALAGWYSGTPFWPPEGLRRLHPNAENRESADESVRSLKFLGELQIKDYCFLGQD